MHCLLSFFLILDVLIKLQGVHHFDVIWILHFLFLILLFVFLILHFLFVVYLLVDLQADLPAVERLEVNLLAVELLEVELLEVELLEVELLALELFFTITHNQSHTFMIISLI